MRVSVHNSNKVKSVPSKALWIYLNCSKRELASLKHRLQQNQSGNNCWLTFPLSNLNLFLQLCGFVKSSCTKLHNIFECCLKQYLSHADHIYVVLMYFRVLLRLNPIANIDFCSLEYIFRLNVPFRATRCCASINNWAPMSSEWLYRTGLRLEILKTPEI